MLENYLIEKLNRKETIYGTMIDEIRNPLIITLLSKAGFDFAIIDMEHGTYSLYDIQQFVLAAKSTSITIIVRTPGKDLQTISKILDAGAHGIMVPHVETKAEVKLIIQASKYPPLGARGYGPRGIVTDFDDVSSGEKVKKINSKTLIWIQVESLDAIDTIEQLISFSEINGVIIGPADLSVSMGIPGDFNDKKIIQAIDRVVTETKLKGIHCGTHLRNIEKLKEWNKKGMKIIIYSTTFDSLLEKFLKDLSILRSGD